MLPDRMANSVGKCVSSCGAAPSRQGRKKLANTEYLGWKRPHKSLCPTPDFTPKGV